MESAAVSWEEEADSEDSEVAAEVAVGEAREAEVAVAREARAEEGAARGEEAARWVGPGLATSTASMEEAGAEVARATRIAQLRIEGTAPRDAEEVGTAAPRAAALSGAAGGAEEAVEARARAVGLAVATARPRVPASRRKGSGRGDWGRSRPRASSRHRSTVQSRGSGTRTTLGAPRFDARRCLLVRRRSNLRTEFARRCRAGRDSRRHSARRRPRHRPTTRRDVPSR